MPENHTYEQISRLPFFFILGRPRSGTTLLRTLLDVHPHINIPLENSGLIHLYFKYRSRTWEHKTLDEFLVDFKNLNFIENWKLDWTSIAIILAHTSPGSLSFPEVIRIIYYHYQSQSSKKDIVCLGDKSPLNSLYARELFKVFPHARYIHLVRDYRANLASMSKHEVFSPSTTVMLMQWKKSANQISKQAALYPDRYLQLRYEDLVKDPGTTYEQVCDFLQVKFIPELLDAEYRKDTVRDVYNEAFLKQWQPDLSGKISSANIDKWKTELSTAKVRQADYMAGKTGYRFRYESNTDRYPPVFRILAEMKKLLFHLNEMNRYLYDRLPYKMKERIKNRKFILSYRLIQFYRKKFGEN